MFGKKGASAGKKPKLDDAAKAAVMASASGGGGGAAAGAAGGAQLLSRALERYNLRMRRVCRAGAAMAGVAALILLVGALLVHFFKAYVRSDSWKKGLGITGIVLLLFSLLVLGIGIALLVWAYHLMKNRERDAVFQPTDLQAPEPGSLPGSAYPRQGEAAAAVPVDGRDEEAEPLRAKEAATADASAPPAQSATTAEEAA